MIEHVVKLPLIRKGMDARMRKALAGLPYIEIRKILAPRSDGGKAKQAIMARRARLAKRGGAT